MHAPSNAMPRRGFFDPLGLLGRSVIAVIGYVGGVALLSAGALGAFAWPARRRGETVTAPGFWKMLFYQLFWMIAAGFPIVAMVHIAVGSFLSLQAYYGSTFVDGTGAVVGVGLLRNLGGLMTGLTFSGIMAARMIPELLAVADRLTTLDLGPAAAGPGEPGRQRAPQLDGADSPPVLAIAACRLAAPRIAAGGIACLLLSQWGIAIGTFVGWRASQSMMGLPTETFFMMLQKMMWLRDVIGLVVKGLFFGAVPAAICCYEAFRACAIDTGPDEANPTVAELAHGVVLPWWVPTFRAYCVSCAAILLMNMSWFILFYHAVPYYGPTLLAPPGP